MIQGTSWSSGTWLASYIPTLGAQMVWGPEGGGRSEGQAKPTYLSMNLQLQARGGS